MSNTGEWETDYLRGEQLLSALGDAGSFAECQGALAGLICTRGSVTLETWLEHMNGNVGIRFLQTDEKQLLQRILDQTTAQFEQSEKEFQPVLPDDQQPIAQRIQAIMDWASGMLFAIGLQDENRIPRLSETAREFVEDLVDITNIDIDTIEDDEESEIAYTDIVEYVRVGTALLYEDFARLPPSPTEILN